MRFFEFKQTIPNGQPLYEAAKDSTLTAVNAIHTVDMLDAIADKVPEEEVGRLVQFNAMLEKIVAKSAAFMEKMGIPLPDTEAAPVAEPAPVAQAAPVAEPVAQAPAQPSELDRVAQLAGVPQPAPAPVAAPEEETEEEPISEASLYKREHVYDFPEELAHAKGELAKIKGRIKAVVAWPSETPQIEEFKNHQLKEWQDALTSAMRVYKGFKAAVADRDLFKQQKEEADKFLQDIAGFLTVLGDRVQGYSEGLESIDVNKLRSQEKKKIVNAQQFTSTLRQALFGLIIEIANKRETTVTPEQIKGFLQACVKGQVIDMNAVVANDTGNIRDALNGDWRTVFDLFVEKNIFEYSPGTTSGAVGPGEMALSMMANPTEKAPVGDLMVNGVMYEVKAGKKTGGRLNSKGIGKATTGWQVWRAIIDKIVQGDPKDKTFPGAPKTAKFYSNSDAKGAKIEKGVGPKQFSSDVVNANTNKSTGRVSYKLASKYNWNKKGFDALNNEVLVYSNRAATVQLFVESLKSIFNNYKAVAQKMEQLGVGSPAGLIGQAISRDGKKVSLDKMNEAITAMAFVSYHLEDHIENVLFLNTLSLDYSIIRGEGGDPTDLVEKMRAGFVKVTSGFNWNDAQQTPTPSYNTSRPDSPDEEV